MEKEQAAASAHKPSSRQPAQPVKPGPTTKMTSQMTIQQKFQCFDSDDEDEISLRVCREICTTLTLGPIAPRHG
jgi:hypothetical protein